MSNEEHDRLNRIAEEIGFLDGTFDRVIKKIENERGDTSWVEKIEVRYNHHRDRVEITTVQENTNCCDDDECQVEGFKIEGDE